MSEGESRKRERRLRALLASAGMTSGPRPPAPRLGDLPALAGDVLGLYRDLGGVLEAPRLCPGSWDMRFDDILVELDEEQHFNRYRGRTFTPSWTDQLPWAQAYRAWCVSGEGTCLAKKSGRGFWTNPSTEGQFGPAGPNRDLEHSGGAPRWKQRALYDAMRDAWALDNGRYRVARLSVYDTVDGVSLDRLLQGAATVDPSALAAFVRTRAAGGAAKAGAPTWTLDCGSGPQLSHRDEPAM